MATAGSGYSVLLYLITGAFFCFGLFLFILAWRGKKIDDHPWCRNCRFDLFGRDNTRDNTCPECGSDLTKPKAIGVGQRQKRRGMLYVGTLVFFIGITGLGIKGYTDAVGFNWQHNKPVWMLMREANGTPGNGSSDDALFELRRRYDAGELKTEQVDDIIETALKHQADALRPWQPAWGNFIQQARTDSVVSDEQWVRYAEGMLVAPHRLVVRPEVVMGTERLSIKLEDRDVRMGDGNQEYWLALMSRSIAVGPQFTGQIGMSGGGLIYWSNQGSRTANLRLSEEDWAKLGPGEHKVVFEYEVALFKNGFQAENPAMAIAANTIQLEAIIKVLPAESSTVTVINDEAYRQGVEDGIRIRKIQCFPPTNQRKPDRHTLELSFGIDRLVFPIAGTTTSSSTDGVKTTEVKMQTIDLACDIIVHHKEIDYIVGSMAFAGDGDSTGLGMFGNIYADVRGQTVDIILRPSVETAENSLDCEEIWGHEIVFKDVVVK